MFKATRHAELVALSALSEETTLENCDIFVTVEPCAMCAAALSLLGSYFLLELTAKV